MPCKSWRVGGNWSSDRMGDIHLRTFCRHGMAPDGRGRWAVDEVLRVERRIALPGEEGRTGEWQRMALIRWRGADRMQHQAHVESWRPFEFLTPDLQRRWIKPRGPAQPKRERPTHQQDGRVTKRSPRLMGEAAEAGL